MGDTLFVLSLSLNTFFVPVSCFSTCKYINHSYPVAVYTLNTRSTPYCFFLMAKKLPFTFGAVVWHSKHQAYLCCNFQTSKYVRRSLVCCWFPSEYVIVAFYFAIVSATPIFFQFNLQIHQTRYAS